MCLSSTVSGDYYTKNDLGLLMMMAYLLLTIICSTTFIYTPIVGNG